jgi:hypothetical protein
VKKWRVARRKKRKNERIEQRKSERAGGREEVKEFKGYRV